jgi:aryl-alcohol dehydrogenase-like predicted oxidoreductase
MVSALGVGTNRWGSRTSTKDGLSGTYRAALDAGVDFFDTAEVYSAGRSERLLGECARQETRPLVVASKFAPFPVRVTKLQFMRALDRSLARMGRDSIDLYYLHFPYSPRGVGFWMEAMGRAVRAGKIRAVGVSNCNVRQMRRAAAVLARHDVPLAANQVHYSLVRRAPEKNGVLDACRELDVALVAYRPLESGVLKGGSPSGRQASLVGMLNEVASGHGRTPSQVALAWLLHKDDLVVPIPGATKPHHARENAEGLTLKLRPDELTALDRASSAAA